MWRGGFPLFVLALSICQGQSRWTDDENPDLNRIISNLIQRVDELEQAHEQDKKLREELDHLRSKHEALEEKVRQLGPCNMELPQGPIETDDVNSSGQAVVFKPDDQNTEGQGRFGDRMINRGRKVNKRISAGPSIATVAFSSYLSQRTSNHAADKPIIFDRVLLSAGGYYDEHTGIFTCRVPGIYVFFWAIGTDQGDWTQTDLVRNGNIVGSTVSGDPNNGHSSSGSNMVILNLFPDDRLWLKFNSSHTPGPNNGIEPFLSSFNGFLLFY